MEYKKGILQKSPHNDTVVIYEEDLLTDNDMGALLENPFQFRIDGEFTGKGLYIRKDYHWRLIEDNKGLLVLVPTYLAKV